MLPLDFFIQSLSGSTPPPASPELQSLWWTRKGNWEKAHQIVQDLKTAEAAWIHAHLHRVEGDPSNARYWYSLAGKPPCSDPLPEEWEALAKALIK